MDTINRKMVLNHCRARIETHIENAHVDMELGDEEGRINWDTGIDIYTLVVVMSLLFKMSGFVIAFLPGSKCLLISWFQSPSAVILVPKKIKPVSFHFFPFYLS